MMVGTGRALFSARACTGCSPGRGTGNVRANMPFKAAGTDQPGIKTVTAAETAACEALRHCVKVRESFHRDRTAYREGADPSFAGSCRTVDASEFLFSVRRRTD